MSEADDIVARDAQAAEKFSPDVGREQIGGVYARALLAAAETAGDTAAVLDELNAVVDEALDKFPKLEAVLASPLVSHEEKSTLLDRAFRGKTSPLFLNFLKVVSRHGRLDCLRAIRRQARKIYEESQGHARIRLTTAVAMPAAEAEKIAAALGSALGWRPILETAVDPALVGGAVLRVGDTVYDGSVAYQLQSIRQQMIDRSVHEIQSRRDSFRNPAGS